MNLNTLMDPVFFWEIKNYFFKAQDETIGKKIFAVIDILFKTKNTFPMRSRLKRSFLTDFQNFYSNFLFLMPSILIGSLFFSKEILITKKMAAWKVVMFVLCVHIYALSIKLRCGIFDGNKTDLKKNIFKNTAGFIDCIKLQRF